MTSTGPRTPRSSTSAWAIGSSAVLKSLSIRRSRSTSGGGAAGSAGSGSGSSSVSSHAGLAALSRCFVRAALKTCPPTSTWKTTYGSACCALPGVVESMSGTPEAWMPLSFSVRPEAAAADSSICAAATPKRKKKVWGTRSGRHPDLG